MITVSPKWTRITRTVNLFMGIFGLGLCISITGPTLIDLGNNVGMDTEPMSYVLVGRTVAYCVSAALGGIILDKCNRQILLSICIFMVGATTFLIPWWKSYWLLIVIVFVSGFFMGPMDTGGCILCLDLWKENPAPYLQALNFMYGVGSIISPLIAEPFLSPAAQNQSDTEDDRSFSPIQVGNTTVDPTGYPSSTPSYPEGYYIINAYVIVGSYMVFAAICFLVSYAINPNAVTSNTEKERPLLETGMGRISIIVIVLTSVQLTAYVGLEYSYSQFLTTFAYHCELGLSKSIGSFMTSVYWGAYTGMRFLSIFTATKFSPFILLFINIVAMNLGAIILTIWGNSNEIMLWVGNVIIGLGMGSTYPTVFSWAERYIGISNKIGGMFLTFGTVGGALLQLLVGSYIKDYPMIMMYVSLSCTIVCLLVFILQWRLKNVTTNKISPE